MQLYKHYWCWMLHRAVELKLACKEMWWILVFLAGFGITVRFAELIPIPILSLYIVNSVKCGLNPAIKRACQRGTGLFVAGRLPQTSRSPLPSHARISRGSTITFASLDIENPVYWDFYAVILACKWLLVAFYNFLTWTAFNTT